MCSATSGRQPSASTRACVLSTGSQVALSSDVIWASIRMFR